jgi:hypothetical protein
MEDFVTNISLSRYPLDIPDRICPADHVAIYHVKLQKIRQKNEDFDQYLIVDIRLVYQTGNVLTTTWQFAT